MGDSTVVVSVISVDDAESSLVVEYVAQRPAVDSLPSQLPPQLHLAGSPYRQPLQGSALLPRGVLSGDWYLLLPSSLSAESLLVVE